jgi:hypothetical protein
MSCPSLLNVMAVFRPVSVAGGGMGMPPRAGRVARASRGEARCGTHPTLHQFPIDGSSRMIHSGGVRLRKKTLCPTRPPGKTYVGQSGDIPSRLRDHEASGKFPAGTKVSTTEVKGGKTAREIAEHNRIQEHGGVSSQPGSNTLARSITNLIGVVTEGNGAWRQRGNCSDTFSPLDWAIGDCATDQRTQVRRPQ